MKREKRINWRRILTLENGKADETLSRKQVKSTFQSKLVLVLSFSIVYKEIILILSMPDSGYRYLS